ncbi:GntR family transcriptional regulator [Streptomonospora sp. S1-112]|uniref:GntR family transcriptional regulator n=1 Tax=Streptomonospora mangrovi TaxID=2883123 RepID=A0A9X3NG14_9ACTN|nr:GntR family transcriptional regulator [Streptomonospora mangrovi]MDA0562862.1 GntR family transcriptional regulator [Streptomonospora mangrovi]
MEETPPKRPYRHVPIADELRQAIRAGTYPPGAQLPSSLDIARRYRVGDRTGRAVLRQLVHEGIAEARQGHGTYVTQVPPEAARARRRTHSARRLAPAEAPGPGDADLTMRHLSGPSTEEPPADIALRIDAEAAAVTRYLLCEGDADAVIGLRTVYDTGRPDEADSVLTHTTARTATPGEARHLGPGAVVLCHDETHTAAAPTRAVRTVWRGDRVRLADFYRTDA